MKGKIYLLLLVLGFSLNAMSQNNKKSDSDSLRVPNGSDAIQEMPKFPGGAEEFGKFLQKNIKYPLQAENKKIQGIVFVSFIVENDGALSNFKALHEPGEGLGDEAIRVLKLSPKWSPGVDGNEKVRVKITIPVSFHLPKG